MVLSITPLTLRLTGVILSCFILLPLDAQDEIKWGKIPKDDLEMTVYAPDTEADAVVLADQGLVRFDIRSVDRPIMVERHVRIKYLTQAGIEEYGNVEVAYYSEDQYNVLTTFKAQVYLPNGDEVDVKKEHMFKSEDDDTWTTESIALPGLQVGAVVEYRYILRSSGFVNPVDWYFQREIPVRYSDLTVEIPEWFRYVKLSQGIIVPEHTSKVSRDMVHPADAARFGVYSSGQHSGSVEVKTTFDRYIARQIPALKPEKHITTMDNYYTRLRYQLQSVALPTSPVQQVMSTWTKVAEDLLIHENFGKQYTVKRHGDSVLEFVGITSNDGVSQKEAAIRLYDALGKQLQWNGQYRFLTPKTVSNTIKERGGATGDLNIALLAGLVQLGIEAYPVVTSTRAHGQVLELYPFMSQFNHTLVLAFPDGQPMYFDLSGDHHPAGLPRLNALNYRGWMVKEGASEWVNVATDYSKSTQYFQLACTPEGKLEGILQVKHTGYLAAAHRATYWSEPEAYAGHSLHDYAASMELLELTPQEPENKNAAWSFSCNVSSDAGTVAGDLIYLTPVFSKSLTENVFKSETRTFPVEYNYPVAEKWIVDIQVPEGYIIESLPESIKLESEGGGISFVYRTGEMNGKIQLVLDFGVHQLKFEPDQYAILRTVYSEIASVASEQIVLKKI